jgi:hypothetical protein
MLHNIIIVLTVRMLLINLSRHFGLIKSNSQQMTLGPEDGGSMFLQNGKKQNTNVQQSRSRLYSYH